MNRTVQAEVNPEHLTTGSTLKVTKKKDAMDKFVALCKLVDQGRVDPRNPEDVKTKKTLSEAIDAFLETKQHLRAKSRHAYRLSLKGLKAHTPPNLMIAHLDASHVHAAVHARKKRKVEGRIVLEDVTPATKKHRHRHIGVFVRWAIEEEHLYKNPMKGVKLPKSPKRMPEFLSPGEVERILLGIDAHVKMKKSGGHIRDGEVFWLKDVILIAVGTGMRLGELFSMRWRDVDFDSGFICVRNTNSFQTKSGNERWIPLVGDALEVLKRLQDERSDDRDGPVLTYSNGNPITPGYASKRFKKFVRLAKLDERFKFHSLRHTTASWLTMKGVSPAIIQQILGHADISTTMIYAQLAPDTMKKAMEMAFE